MSRVELPATSPQRHLRCTRCQRAIPCDLPELERWEEELAERFGFALQSRTYELCGICRECRDKLEPLT